MRPRTLALPLLLLSLSSLTIYKLYFLISIFYSHSGPAFTQQQVLQSWEITQNTTSVSVEGGDGDGKEGEKIPKIIHQVFHNWKEPGNDILPLDWDFVRASCEVLHPEWEIKLWTASTSRTFIQEFYPWFLDTYDGYRFPIQRVDTIRYFLLRHFGGIYIDLDNGCKQSLDPLLQYPAFLTDGGRGALSNNILGSTPLHPFWVKVTDSLIPFDYNYLFPYVTISYASGQWFLTSVFETYSRQVKSKSISKHGKIGGGGGGDGGEGNRGIGEGEVVRVMMDTRKEFERDGKWIFFTQEGGGSWVGWDNYFFAWVGDWWFLIVLGSVGLGGAWWWWRGRRGGYRKVDGEDKGDA